MENGSLLTAEEAAQQLRVSPDTVRRFLRDKKLHGVRVGGQWRIPTDAIQGVYLPAGEILEEQIITLREHEIEGVKIPAGTVGYVVARTRGVGGCYGDTITVHETPAWLRAESQFPDFVLDLFQQNHSWKFVPNDGSSRILQIPRALLQNLRALISTAYSATTEKERDAALESAYVSIRAALGPNDRSDEDAIPKAVEARIKALLHV